ncbi:MAG: hypothetical protein IPH60_08530 [Flavobacteriales bacterium]|nr:hypothetical protein [Flavobacteriales bacterium]
MAVTMACEKPASCRSSLGNWERVIDHRVAYDAVYQRYLATRQAVDRKLCGTR